MSGYQEIRCGCSQLARSFEKCVAPHWCSVKRVRLKNPIAAGDTEVADGAMHCVYGIGLLEHSMQCAPVYFSPYLAMSWGLQSCRGLSVLLFALSHKGITFKCNHIWVLCQ
jgi:hypothetical protein